MFSPFYQHSVLYISWLRYHPETRTGARRKQRSLSSMKRCLPLGGDLSAFRWRGALMRYVQQLILSMKPALRALWTKKPKMSSREKMTNAKMAPFRFAIKYWPSLAGFQYSGLVRSRSPWKHPIPCWNPKKPTRLIIMETIINKTIRITYNSWYFTNSKKAKRKVSSHQTYA